MPARWSFDDDGTVVGTPRPNANTWFHEPCGAWWEEADGTVVFAAGASSRRGSAGGSAVAAQGVIGLLETGRVATYVVHEGQKTSAAVVNGVDVGQSVSRAYEFPLALTC